MKNFFRRFLPLALIAVFILSITAFVVHADERDDYRDMILIAAEENGLEISEADPLFEEAIDVLQAGDVESTLEKIRFMSIRQTLLDRVAEFGLSVDFDYLDVAVQDINAGAEVEDVVDALVLKAEQDDQVADDVDDDADEPSSEVGEEETEERAPPAEEDDSEETTTAPEEDDSSEEPAKETFEPALDEEAAEQAMQDAQERTREALGDFSFSGARVVNLEETHGEMLNQLRDGMSGLAADVDEISNRSQLAAAGIAGVELPQEVDSIEEDQLDEIAARLSDVNFSEAIGEAQELIGDAQVGLRDAIDVLESMGRHEEAQELVPYLEKLAAAASYQGLEKVGATRAAISNRDYLEAVNAASAGLSETADLLEALGADQLAEQLGTYGAGLGVISDFGGIDNITSTWEAIEKGEYVGALGEANDGLAEVANTLAELGQEDLAEQILQYNATIDLAHGGLQHGDAAWDAIGEGDYQTALSEAAGSLGSINDLIASVRGEIDDDGTINVNTATVRELEELPGIGTTYAEAIVAYREENGPFTNADDLENVSGIGPARLEGMVDYVRLEDSSRHQILDNLELISAGAGNLAENMERIAEYEGIEKGSEAWDSLKDGDYLAAISTTGAALDETMELLYDLTGGGINVNTASAEELEGLPGIGPSYAEAIVEYRSENGPFTSVDELENVAGIGPSRLEEISGHVRLEDSGYDEALAKLGEVNGHVESVTSRISAVSGYSGIEYGSEAWDALQEGDYLEAIRSASAGLEETADLVYALTGGGVNVNTASAARLETLPGVGPAYAQAIVDYREDNGAFENIDDLVNVPGIGPSRLEDIRDMVRLEDSTHDKVLEQLYDVTDKVGLVTDVGATAIDSFKESGEVRQTLDAIYAEHGEELEPYLERALEEAVNITGLSEEELVTISEGVVSLTDFALTYRETGDFDEALEHFAPQLAAIEERIESEIRERQAGLMNMLNERFGDVEVSEDGSISFSSGELPDVDMDDLMDMADNNMQEVWAGQSDGSLSEGYADKPEEYIVAELWAGVVAEAELSDEVRTQLEMGNFGEMDARAAYELSARAEASGIDLGRHVVRDPATGRYHTYDGFRQELYVGARARADASVDFDWEDIELFGTAIEQQTHASAYAEVRAEAQITNVVGIVDGQAIGGHHRAGAFAGAMAGAQISHEIANEHLGAAEATVGGQVGVGIGAEAALDWQVGWDGIEFDGSLFAGLGVSAGIEFSFAYTPPEWLEDAAGNIASKVMDVGTDIAEGIVEVGSSVIDSVTDGVKDAAETVRSWLPWSVDEELASESDESPLRRYGDVDEAEEEETAAADEATGSARELRELIREREVGADDDYITSQDEEEENPFISRIRIW